MIRIIGKRFNAKEFYKIYQLLKHEEFIINFGSLGVRFAKTNDYLFDISIVALGNDFGDNNFLTRENLVKRKVVIKEVVKKGVDTHVDKGKVTEEDLF